MSESTESLQTQLMELLQSDGYQPLRRSEIAQKFRLDSADRRTLRYVLRNLEANGQIVLLRKNRIALPSHGTTITGRVAMHQKGFAFVRLDPDQDVDLGGDVFIPPDGLGAARDSDRVLVSIFESAVRPGNLPSFATSDGKAFEGRVLRVLERGFSEVVGLLQKKSNGWRLMPDNPRLEDIAVTGFAGGITPIKEHKAVVELKEPPYPGAPLTGIVVEDLGSFNDPGVDMLALMRMYELEQEFPADVQRVADGFSEASIAEIAENRRDLRAWTTFTIDPIDARDFDDALSLRKLENGNWEIGVHIADVSAFLEKDDAVDVEAVRRATSVYLVDRVVPMLPEKLTNELCSLRPEKDRLAHSILIEVDEDARLVGFDTGKSVIHSKARLYYEQAQAFMDDNNAEGIPVDVQHSIRALLPLTRKLRAQRFSDGSMLFESTEIKCIIDENGKVSRVEKRVSQEANQLIEECMLLANKVVASILTRHEDTSGIYRIHEPPSEKQWGNMAEELRTLGIHDPPENREDLNAILGGNIPEHLTFPVTIAILRNLNRAVYSADLHEHFGLAFEEYSHFTSPIRRFPDLMAHRMLEAIENNQPAPYSLDDVKVLAKHCSEREQMAEEAEKQSVQIKLFNYYQDRLWAGETGPLTGCVTGILSKGLIVELTETLQRGLISFQSIEGDYYEINASSTVARGARGGHEFRLGDKVDVFLSRVDVRNRKIDFILTELPGGARGRKGSGKKQKGRGGKRQQYGGGARGSKAKGARSTGRKKRKR